MTFSFPRLVHECWCLNFFFWLVIVDTSRNFATAFSRAVVYELRFCQLSHPFLFLPKDGTYPPGMPCLETGLWSTGTRRFPCGQARFHLCLNHELSSRTQDKLDDDVRGAGRSPSQTRHCRASWVWLSLELLLHNSFFCIPHFDISSDIAGFSRSLSAHSRHPGQRPFFQLYNTRALNSGQHNVAK